MLKKVIGIVLLVWFFFAFNNYLDAKFYGNTAAAIGEFMPVGLLGLIAIILVSSKSKKKNKE
ncbi:hypothetical protein [Altibacter sp. HG106]|uniref:hypothetical protein n=1 Tax=Altibacter sp. HG106 TaxID=3023937 RepID=UPI00234FB77D|nr:hypothetical protein [Altibacter sp. HG106]MDC7995511.1 hypothetical protein [Altibacter sp. HG106]